MFILGLILGVLIAILLLLGVYILVDKRMILEVNQAVDTFTAKNKGTIIQPTSFEDESRQYVVEENRRKGLDTRIEDLL
jgi:hypothetical protein